MSAPSLCRLRVPLLCRSASPPGVCLSSVHNSSGISFSEHQQAVLRLSKRWPIVCCPYTYHLNAYCASGRYPAANCPAQNVVVHCPVPHYLSRSRFTPHRALCSHPYPHIAAQQLCLPNSPPSKHPAKTETHLRTAENVCYPVQAASKTVS